MIEVVVDDADAEKTTAAIAKSRQDPARSATVKVFRPARWKARPVSRTDETGFRKPSKGTDRTKAFSLQTATRSGWPFFPCPWRARSRAAFPGWEGEAFQLEPHRPSPTSLGKYCSRILAAHQGAHRAFRLIPSRWPRNPSAMAPKKRKPPSPRREKKTLEGFPAPGVSCRSAERPLADRARIRGAARRWSKPIVVNPAGSNAYRTRTLWAIALPPPGGPRGRSAGAFGRASTKAGL